VITLWVPRDSPPTDDVTRRLWRMCPENLRLLLNATRCIPTVGHHGEGGGPSISRSKAGGNTASRPVDKRHITVVALLLRTR
jgi:hypothetical protein